MFLLRTLCSKSATNGESRLDVAGQSDCPHRTASADQDAEMDALTDIERLNLYGLMYMRDMARTDIAAAIVCFGLSRKTLQRIGSMSPQDIVKLVQQAGKQLLFTPCADVVSLLDRAVSSQRIEQPVRALANTASAAFGLRS
jgi:hypothetical protein